MKDKWLTHRALGFSFSLSNAGTFPEAWARLYTEYHPGSVMVAEDNPFLQAELRHLFESADRLRSAVSSDLYRH
jgi:hypothetical protein